jgi:hypothetical protein
MTEEYCFICNILVDGIVRPVVHIRNEKREVMALCCACHRHVSFHHYIPEGRSTYDYIKYDVIWGGRNEANRV